MGQKSSTVSSSKDLRLFDNRGGDWALAIPTSAPALVAALRDLVGIYTDFQNGRFERREMTLSGEACRREMTLSGEARRLEMTLSGEARRIEMALSGEALRREMVLTGEAFRDGIPTVKCFVSVLATYFQRRNYLELFYAFIAGSNAAVYWLDVLQGSSALEEIGRKIHRELQAQTGLSAPTAFARQVDKSIRHEIHNTPPGGKHIYFLYHPDTDWHAEFFDHAKHDPLPQNFLGLSDNLDSLCAWMLFLRQQLDEDGTQARFYILIPAYRPMVVKEPLDFPKQLFPLTVRGDIHDSKPYVWFNLPAIGNVSSDLLSLERIGNLSSPNEWESLASVAAGVGTTWCGVLASYAVVAASGPLAPLAAVGCFAGAIAAGRCAQEGVESMFASDGPRILGQFDDPVSSRQ
ncbi:uncharacterized protein Aud_009459 [Aspergillus udagawae]|uniref:Uncharacterized protein n=1 Tax=Aspergillus udagawae TaxID=91492 RepID=A0A8E0V414_9EURO|nr:uncharacterized protein Aud_009459 [Aspergillus udagawae]GIC92980.1 hypothetical protein Aud_009459 [Aspergillus udagawae]